MAEAADSVREGVSEYYGKTLGKTEDLKTAACCIGGETSADTRRLLKNVHDDVLSRFYGCGSPIPPLLEGCTVLDLGCGTGRDVYVMSQLVGPKGNVIGVDMTDEQLAVARNTLAWHMEKFGYKKANVSFKKGLIEDLSTAGIADNSIDVVTSNCVVNLAADKSAVLREVFRVLKPGGELYFSDVYSDRRVPEAAKADKVAWGECLAGALYRGDFRRLMAGVGFSDYRVVTRRPFAVNDPALRALLGATQFSSETVRAVKLPAWGLEDAAEDYGQSAMYNGAVADSKAEFVLDLATRFPMGAAVRISGNTAALLTLSRYEGAFSVTPRGPHLGPFDAGNPTDPQDFCLPGGCCGPADQPCCPPGKCC